MANTLISTLADAITRQEGFFPGSASYRNNNPGNIMDIDYYKKTGEFKLKAYATLEEGRAALESLVEKYINAGHTLTSFFAKYAPDSHGNNNSTVYANNVAQWTGLPVDVPLNQLGDYSGPTGTDFTASMSPASPSPSDSGFGVLPAVALLGVGAAALWLWLTD